MMARAAGGAAGAAVEVDLAADARVEPGAQRVGADLAGQVDLQGRVDGHHLVLLADDERVVDVLGGVEGEERVVVDVVVQPPGAHAEAGDDLAPVDGLLGSGDDPGLDQVDDGVGEHLGVDAQVLLVLEELDHRRGGSGRCRTRSSSRPRPGRRCTRRWAGSVGASGATLERTLSVKVLAVSISGSSTGTRMSRS